jgi:hypothetical protein
LPFAFEQGSVQSVTGDNQHDVESVSAENCATVDDFLHANGFAPWSQPCRGHDNASITGRPVISEGTAGHQIEGEMFGHNPGGEVVDSLPGDALPQELVVAFPAGKYQIGGLQGRAIQQKTGISFQALPIRACLEWLIDDIGERQASTAIGSEQVRCCFVAMTAEPDIGTGSRELPHGFSSFSDQSCVLPGFEIRQAAAECAGDLDCVFLVAKKIIERQAVTSVAHHVIVIDSREFCMELLVGLDRSGCLVEDTLVTGADGFCRFGRTVQRGKRQIKGNVHDDPRTFMVWGDEGLPETNGERFIVAHGVLNVK